MSKKGFTYTLQIDAEINDLIAKTNQVKKSMQSVMDAGKAPGAEKIFGSIERAIDRLQTKASQPIESVAAFASLQKDAAAVGASLGKLGSIIENLGNMDVADKLDLLPPNLKKQIEEVSVALNAFSKAQAQAAQKSQALVDAETDLAAAQRELKKAEGKIQEKKALITAQQSLVNSTHAEADAIKAKIEALKKYQSTVAAYEAAGGDKRKVGGGKEELTGLNLPADRNAAKKVVAPDFDLGNAQAVADEIARLTAEYTTASKAVTDAESTQRRYSKQLSEATNAATVASGKVTTLKQSVAQLNQEFEKDKAKNVQVAYAKLRTEAGKLGIDLTNIPVDYTEQNLLELNDAMNKLAIDGIAQVDQGLNIIETDFNETGEAAQNFGDKINESGEQIKGLDKTASDISALKSRITQFIGLEGAINLGQKAMRNAFQTVKELDAAMTEMAVVTDLSVGDYWDQLSDYTDRANELGVSIKGAYEAATLYYQQGLKSNEVTAVTNETLKMARIAGLSAEDATNKMTAALRGFNMELNETSAQRIADVYSELAAITASDVDEISSAMTKTASIAASAGMEFETTAAFLSQIIETTRESAETAGTALKTVIARFQELKKDPSEMGEIDGEIVDANKIETALRSVGVALRDSSGQFRELDDVFLELSGKWDTLDTNTQRYIATIAAGSRQQSRFIAMMSDYNRTQELVTAANSSAGASNEQFEKTLDSLQTKLTQLKNSWDTFTMGLMNNEIIKAGVDLLTQIMDAINGLIALFDKFGLGSVASLGMVIGALALGTVALNSFEKNLMQVDAQGRRVNTTFGAIKKTGQDGFTKVTTAIKKTYNTLKKMNKESKAVKILKNKEVIDLQNAYNKAVEKEQKIDQARYATKQKINSQQGASATLNQHYAATEQIASNATKERVKAEGALLAALNLTDNEKAEATALGALGIATDKAAILAKSGVTAAMVAEYAAEHELTEEQAANILLEQLQNKIKGQSITTRLLGLLGLKMENGELKKNTGAKGANLVATVAGTVVQWLYNVALWAGCPPTIALTVALIALVAIILLAVVAIIAIVAAFKQMKKNSPEGKLEAAKEATEAAGEAAEQAKEAYNNLNESLNNLEDKYDALEELTEGTREWRDAMKEINNEVMDLVEQYPELAKLVKNEDGVLKLDIESNEVQAVLDDYEARAMQASSAEMASKISVLKAQTAVDYKNLSNKATVENEVALGLYKAGAAYATAVATYGTGYLGGAAVGTALQSDIKRREQEGKEQTEKLSQALAEGLLQQDEFGNWSVVEGAEEQLETIGLAADAAENMANKLDEGAKELKEYGEAVAQRKEQEEALYEAMALNAVQMVDTAGMLADEIQQVNVAASEEYIKTFEKDAMLEIGKKIKDMGKYEQRDWVKAQAQSLYGTEDVEVDGDEVTIGSGDEAKTITMEEFLKQLASSSGTEDAAKALENLPKAIDNLGKKMGKGASAALERSYLKKEGGAMTKADIKNLKEIDDASLQTMYDSLSDEDKKSFGDFETFKNHIEETLKLSEAAFEKASEGLKAMGATIELNEKFDSEAAKGFANQLEYIMVGAGQEGAEQINSMLNNLTRGMDVETLNKFMGQLNAMDWKNLEDWENLPGILGELKIALPTNELQEFIDVASVSAGAIKNIDLDALNEKMLSLQNLSKNAKFGERRVSDSDYASLVEEDPELAKQFQQTLEGDYVFMGAIEELILAISKNTDALLGQTTNQLQNKVDAGQLLEEMQNSWKFSDGSKADINDWRGWENDDLKTNVEGFLKMFKQEAVNRKMDLTQLGIAGLSNDMDVDALLTDEKKLQEVMEGLTTVFGSLEQNTDLLNTKITNSLGLTYQNRDATINSSEATKYRTILKKTGTLNENEQNELDASTKAIVAQAETSGISIVDIEKYKNSLSGLKDLQKEFSEGKITLDQFRQSYTKLTKEAENFEKQVVNKTNFRNMNTQLEGTISSMGELTEKFDTLKDKSEKIETVGKMVEDLGISINTANYEQISNLVKQITEGGENAYEAFQQLMQMSGESFGLTLEDLALMTSEKWNDSTNQMSETMQAFADRMVAIGSAMWKELGDGSKEFAWATKNNLADAAEAAGTVIEMWENPYDELYNLNQSLNATIRERERLERSYDRALKDSSTSAQELANITGKQLASLKEEAILQKDIAQQSLKNIAQKRVENIQYEGLYSVDYDTGRIQVDWNQAEKMGWNTDEGSEFEEFISYLEEQTEAALDAQDAIDDISDAVDEIEQRGKDATSEIYDQVKEGLVKQYENQITELENINNSIQEASADMISKMQEQIDDARKARDKEKTQSQIADKQTRLAYLKADSSGMNALEIASLEKEISDAQESYTDSLIDDAIEKLQEDNEKAAEQRQEQIELQRSQLEAYVESGKIWEDVQRITNEGFAQVARGVPFAATEAGHLASLAADLNTMNPLEAEDFKEKLEESAKTGAIYTGFTSITGGSPGQSLADVVAALKGTLADLRDESDDPPPKVPSNNPNNDTNEDDGNLGDDQQPPKEEPTTEPEAKPSTQEPSTPTPQPEAKPTIPDDSNNKPSQSYVSRTAWTSYEKAVKDGFSNIMTRSEFLRSSSKKYEVYEEYLDAMYDKYMGSSLEGVAAKEGLFDNKLNTNQLDKSKNNRFTWDLGSQKYRLTAKGPADAEVSQIASARQVPEMALLKFNNTFYAYKNGKAYPITGDFDDKWITYKKYASGGLADFTGPAWLDGTKSKPEIVLNQTDSANFIQLRDILADIFNGSSTTSQEGGKGDNYFDIEISVESLGDDYDVEQLADKIRGMIYDDATYRNVNTINSVR